MDYESIVFNLIINAGNAKSLSFEALHAAKEGDFAKASQLLADAKKELVQAHLVQTSLLQEEAAGSKQPVTLLLVHAQDHLMDAMLAKDLIEEMVELHKELHARKHE